MACSRRIPWPAWLNGWKRAVAFFLFADTLLIVMYWFANFSVRTADGREVCCRPVESQRPTCLSDSHSDQVMSLSCYDTFWDEDGCGLGGELCQVTALAVYPWQLRRAAVSAFAIRTSADRAFHWTGMGVQPFEQSEWIAVRCPGRCAWQPVSRTYTDLSQMANPPPPPSLGAGARESAPASVIRIGGFS